MYSHFHLHKLVKLKDEMHDMYLNRVLRTFAFSLLGIFIPIYLINIGYTLDNVILYFIGQYFTTLFMAPLTGIIESKIGVKKTMLLGTSFFVIFFFFLFTIHIYYWPLLLLSIFYGIEQSLYWIPAITNFAKFSKRGVRGREVGNWISFSQAVTVLAPLLGAWIIVSTSFDALLILASVIMILSVSVLFLTPDHVFPLGRIWSPFSKKNLNFFFLFFSKGSIYTANLLWPLFIYFILPDYFFIAIAATLAGAASAVFTFSIGQISDRTSKLKILKISTFANILVWGAAVFVTNPTQVYVLSFVKGFAYMMMVVPSFAIVCRESLKQNTVGFMIFREVSYAFSRGLFLIVALLLPFSIKFQTVFILAAIFSLYFLIFKRSHR